MNEKTNDAPCCERPTPIDHDHEMDDDSSMDSSDEALCKMLGLKSIKDMVTTIENAINGEDDGNTIRTGANQISTVYDLIRSRSDNMITDLIQQHAIQQQYQTDSVCVFPEELRIPSTLMRRLTDELVWGGPTVQVDRTYETISRCRFSQSRQQQQQQQLVHQPSSDESVAAYEWEQKRVLTRLENFVSFHQEWNLLCNDYLQRCISTALGRPMSLYKEKLNLKPPGGSGFAPHLDEPSLRVVKLGNDDNHNATMGPNNFVTVMVAIDPMTVQNGCLRLVKGCWNETTAVPAVLPETNSNPDAGGRAGKIADAVAETLDFQDVVCSAGTIVAFNGWVPHRSGVNRSSFSRRAVFLTYNEASQGDCHEQYYQKMADLRNAWKDKVGHAKCGRPISTDEQQDLDALATIPRI